MPRRRRIIGSIAILAGLCSVAGPLLLAHPGLDEQIASVNAQIAEHPEDAALYLKRGELHRIHRDWPAAQADLIKAMTLQPDLTVAELCLGRMKLDAGAPAEAKPYLDRYLAKRPNDAEALALRGSALEALGQHLRAAEDLTQCIATPGHDPRPEYYLDRARALQAAGPQYLAQAIQGLDEGRARLGDPVTLQLLALDLELERKNFDGALRRVDELAHASARQEPWLIRRGTILEAAGRPGEAREAYTRAIAAIEALPGARRGTRAVASLESEARAALQRLNEQPQAQ